MTRQDKKIPPLKGAPGFLGNTCMPSLALALIRKKLLVRTSKLRKAQLTRPSFAGAKLAQSKNAGKKSRDHHRGDDRELLGVQPLVRANGLEPLTPCTSSRCSSQLS